MGGGIAQWSDTIYANEIAALFGKLQSNASTGDAILAMQGGYNRAMKYGAGAPASADCDAAGEIMRTYYDTTNHYHYICEGAAGWHKSGAYAP
jgi:hypothetical protein